MCVIFKDNIKAHITHGISKMKETLGDNRSTHRYNDTPSRSSPYDLYNSEIKIIE